MILTTPSAAPRIPRRRVAAVVAVLSLAVAGCGSDASDGSTSPNSAGSGDAATSTAAVDADAFPVSIENRFGTAEIAEAPKRIAVVGLTEQDTLLALGITPVATTEWFGDHDGAIWPWAQDEREALGDAEIEVLTTTDGINVEAVAGVRPDLILGLYSGMTEAEYEQLSAIAPTVAQPKGGSDYEISWQDETLAVARAVGQEAKGQELIDDVEARFVEVREEHPEFAGKTAAIATPYEGTFVYGSEDPRGRFVEALGFEVPDALSELGGEEFGGQLSAEQAELLDVDALIWLDVEDKEGDEPLAGPVYDQLDVHTQAREVFLDSEAKDGLGGATSFVTVLSLPELIDGLVPMLAAAVDGDPATAVPTP